MFLRKPSAETAGRFLATQVDLPFTYPDVGATAKSLPEGYDVDRTRLQLGEGETVYTAAISALKRWQQFRLGWVDVWPGDSPIRPREIVVVMGRSVGAWWLNACRIIYVIDENAPVSRFGFAYGTLPGHMERGEERFLIEFNHADNSVWYEILAFSRPNHYLAKLGYPVVRRFQKRFGRYSSAAMLRACTATE